MVKPEYKASTGAIQATIWNNETINEQGEVVTYKSIKLQKSYKDGNDWKTQNISLNIDQIPKVKLVLDKVYQELMLRQTEENIEIDMTDN